MIRIQGLGATGCDVKELSAEFKRLWPLVNERGRRVLVAIRTAGVGCAGLSKVARTCGFSRATRTARSASERRGFWRWRLAPASSAPPPLFQAAILRRGFTTQEPCSGSKWEPRLKPARGGVKEAPGWAWAGADV